MSESFISEGTITLANDSADVTGNGTNFVIAGVSAGDELYDTATGEKSIVLSVESDTALTLAFPWRFAGGAGRDFMIVLRGSSSRAAENSTKLRMLLEQIEIGAYVLTGDYDNGRAYNLGDLARDQGALWLRIKAGTGNAPPTLPTESNEFWELFLPTVKGDPGDDAQIAIGTVTTLAPGEDAEVENVGSPTAAVFDFGIPKGDTGSVENWTGDYNAGTAYSANDIAFNQDSSWVALQSTTGNAPPTLPTTENAYWQLVAKKANTTVPSRLAAYSAEVTVTDANDHKENGWARILIGGTNTPYSESVPSAPNAAFVLFYHAFNSTFGVQMAIAIQGDHGEGVPSYSFIREFDGDVWRAWKRDHRTIDDLNDYIKTAGRLAEHAQDNVVTDANDHKVNGIARISSGGTNTPDDEGVPGAPATNYILSFKSLQANSGIQEAIGIIVGSDNSDVSSYFYRRELDDGTWRPWRRVYNTIADLDDAVPIFDNGHLTFSEPYSETIAASSPDTGVYLGRINVGSHILMLGATGSHAEEAITLHIQKDYNSATAGSFDHQCIISLMAGDLYQVLSFHAVTVSTTQADLFLVYDINDASVASNIIRWAAIGNPLNRNGFTRPGGVTIPTLDATNDLVPMMKIRTSGISFSDDVNMSGATVLNADDIATANQFKNNTADKLLETGSVWGAAGEVTLTDATSIVMDTSTFINAKVTLAGNRTLQSPTNAKAGQTGYIRIIQDATGSRTLSFGPNWIFPGGVAPVLSTAADAVDMLFYTILPSGTVLGSLVKDVQ